MMSGGSASSTSPSSRHRFEEVGCLFFTEERKQLLEDAVERCALLTWLRGRDDTR
jgi:hypothetical protein